MDQAIVAGVGNIYATEALYRARIDPRTRSDALSIADVRAIARGVRTSMQRVLDAEEGEIGYVNEGAANPFLVYGRAGQPCPQCRGALTRIVLGGRGTVFCARCQRRAGGRAAR
jgi:formamidopyrimidine-DNA glycosylase